MVERTLVAEEVGFDSIWLMDHLAAPMTPEVDTFEGWTIASALAARTARIRIGHLVLCDPFRHAVLLAKMAATLDVISNGRLELGIGWGSVPHELHTFGFGPEPASVRASRLRETLEILQLMFAGEPFDYDARHFTVHGAQGRPVPVQTKIPVHIGGGGPKLTMPLVREFADWWNCPGYALDRLDELRELAGNARVSAQHPVGLAPTNAARDDAIATVERRFGVVERCHRGNCRPGRRRDRTRSRERRRRVRVPVRRFRHAGNNPALHGRSGAEVPHVTAPLVVGVPREVKTDEHRVAITPDGVLEMSHHDVRVLVETCAGVDSSIDDDDYRAAGATIVDRAEDAWGDAGLVLKVKEPQPDELRYLRDDLVLFTYLHLAAYPELGRALLDAGTTGIAYETVQLDNGLLPLLAPMSEVAGRMAPQIGAHFLERRQGGRGVLMGGAPGVRPARVVILGAGNVGWNAAWIAQGMEAEVLLLDKNIDRLRWVDQIHRGRIQTLASNRAAVARAVRDADLVIGAVLLPGGRAPVLVREAMIQTMKPGAVIVDCAIDQGGCIEGIHETTHSDPVFERHHVLQYAVSNVPGAVPNTSTYALTNATLPYALELATKGVAGATRDDPALAAGVNTLRGRVANTTVADALATAATDIASPD